MYRGEIVEQGPTEEIFAQPQHPHTRALLTAAPADAA
jgi:oligopeptide/dipeptide ABC transporter ATP-binding protein